MSRIPGNAGDRPVVIGAGLAGLMCALYLAPRPVIVLAKAPLGADAASDRAQGGLAAALGEDDGPELHATDTIAAGDGLCDAAAVARITAAAPAAIDELIRRGAVFDRLDNGRLALGLEAAHGRRRIVHAHGDGTGHEIMRALIDAVRLTPSITVVENVEARRLVVEDGAVAGVLAAGPSGPLALPCSRVVVATGGIGALFRHTTSPLGSGCGLALAARAGALLADMEFVQFHPTALDVGLDPMPLISEAVRGEGAILVDETGERFMAGQGRAELEPRDVVARAVWRRLVEGRRVFLDARNALGDRFPVRFPGITELCRAAGVDPATQPIPVRPAAHYTVGGVAVDGEGRSSLAGLWACGEAAATGLHGANRLASNSLLEAAACASWVAESIAGTRARRLRPVAVRPLPQPIEPERLREVMDECLGVLRDRAGLERAIATFRPLADASDAAAIGLMIAAAALRREESRGCHFRTDFPAHSPSWARRLTLSLTEAQAFPSPPFRGEGEVGFAARTGIAPLSPLKDGEGARR